jgi:hypothetical protein
LSLAAVLFASAAFVGSESSCQTLHPVAYVERALSVPPTGDHQVDELFVRLRVLQLSLNESERQYLEALTQLSVRLDRISLSEHSRNQDGGPLIAPHDGGAVTRFATSAEPDIAALSAFFRTHTDALRARARVWTVSIDRSAAEQALADPVDAGGTCGLVTSGRGATLCVAQLRRLVVVDIGQDVLTETDSAEHATSEEPDSPEDSVGTSSADSAQLVPDHPELVLAAREALAWLIALQLRMQSVSARALPLRRQFAALLSGRSLPSWVSSEAQAAVSQLTDAPARAQVQSRLIQTTIDSLLAGLQHENAATAQDGTSPR